MIKEKCILLPGTLCDERLWHHQSEHLKSIADLRFGDLTKHDSIESMADFILSDAPDRFALAGLSLGGIVALEIVRQAPERVSRLALLNSNFRAPRIEQVKSWTLLSEMARSGRIDGVINQLLPNLVYNKTGELTSTINKMAEAVGPEAYLRQLIALEKRTGYESFLSTINCPVLIVCCEQDVICPPKISEEMDRIIPNSEFEMIKECGHLSTIEQPEAVTNILREWLTRGERN